MVVKDINAKIITTPAIIVNIEETSEEEGHTETEHDHEGHVHEEHGLHLGFIEEWYIVNPAALLGIFIAYFLPRTKFPHAGHILISTWASSSYILMNMQSDMTIGVLGGILITLFIATWLPCCVSDIIFPLLFVKSDVRLVGCCPDHAHHSHTHEGGGGELEQ
jgi:hypothetical protein